MKRLSALLLLALSASALSLAQVNFRNPSVSASEEDGGLMYQASTTEDLAARIALLEEFFQKYPDSKYKPYALYTMLIAGNDGGQPEKALAAGQQLLELAPEDVEVRHRINQALVSLTRWDDLAPAVDATKPLAESQATGTGDGAEYAQGVLDYLGWASNTAAMGETDPAKKIAWLDRLTTDYPESEYAKAAAPYYIQAYQQTGDTAGMAVWMQKAVDAGVEDESYRYTLAENALANQDNDAAQMHAEKALEILETKAQPEGMADDQWESYKTRMVAYANFAVGRAWVARDTKDAYRTGRTHLLKAVDVIKAEGGARYNVLAYYLGVCYVQLDIQGDNIRKASEWMTEAANTAGPFQEQAKTALAGIRAAI